jgi:hypothetical protein
MVRPGVSPAQCLNGRVTRLGPESQWSCCRDGKLLICRMSGHEGLEKGYVAVKKGIGLLDVERLVTC